MRWHATKAVASTSTDHPQSGRFTPKCTRRKALAVNLGPELDELWQSAEWKTNWSRKTHRTEVGLRVVRVLLALVALGALAVLAILAMQIATGRVSIPVTPTVVALVAAPAVSTLLIVANAKLQARRKLLEQFRLAREASTLSA